MSLKTQRWILFLVPLLLALPFLNRAYFVDDHFFVEIARWLKVHPLEPYDFPINGQLPSQGMSGKEMSLRIVNPLLHHYYMAFLMKIGGEREWFLRLGGVLVSCFSSLLLFELARRWLKNPFWAVLLVLVTPAHLLTSYSLLIDPTMSFFVFLSLYSWIRFSETDQIPWILLSGLSGGLGAITKYTALLIVPVVWAYLIMNHRHVRRPWLALVHTLLTIGTLCLYIAITKKLYGVGHLFAASHESLVNMGLGKIIVLMEFLTGTTLVPLLIWLGFDRKPQLIGALVFFVLCIFFSSSLGGFSVFQSGMMSLSLVTSFLVFLAGVQQRSFVFIWLLGFTGMMMFVMPWVAARYYLVGLPALIFVVVQFIEQRLTINSPRLLKAMVVLTGAFSLTLAYADYQQAEASRNVVQQLKEKNFLDGTNNYYYSRCFTMTYLANAGWKPAIDISFLKPGDRVITSEVSFPMFWGSGKNVPLKQIAFFEYRAGFPKGDFFWPKVMDVRAGAGFYGSAWGPFPFAFSRNPWERFHLYEIISPS